MKNQYFGDVNDYLKYGLLRCLAGAGLRVGVCWMLTPDDERSDGRKVAYLRQPSWERHDTALFGALQEAVHAGVRDVRRAESPSLIPGACFFGDRVPDLRGARQEWFTRALDALSQVDLVFFDPDNGFEIPSRPIGNRNSSKFVAWREIQTTWTRGLSLVVFQHWARERRDDHVLRLRTTMHDVTAGAVVHVVRTPNVAFFIAAQSRHVESLRRGVDDALARWSGMMVADSAAV